MRHILLIALALSMSIVFSAYLVESSEAEAATTRAKFEPRDSLAYTGVAANQQPGDTVRTATRKWGNWTKLMGGKHTRISHTFEGFDTWFGYDFDIAEARNAIPLISWQTGKVAPKTIARAGNAGGKPTDQVILLNAQLSKRYGKPVFLRVNQEMNAHWMPWSSYNANGSRRASTPKDFRNMWRRMDIIFRGGKVSQINQRLAAAGLPRLDRDVRLPGWMGLPSTSNPNSYFAPANNVAFVFNPVDAPGVPNVRGNRWRDYYPGDRYVDWVGQTTYNTTWNATINQRFRWMNSFYRAYSVKRGKPYMLGEWGLEPKKNAGFGDNPAYIRRMLSWTRNHRKVKALVYFSVNDPKGDYRLASYPRSAKVLSRNVSKSGFVKTR